MALATAAGLDVHSVHVHHGHRVSADRDAVTAERIAIQLGTTFRCEFADLSDGPNLEARARDARRRLIGTEALTGHTADDQAETVLLSLLRGSGATGLAGMRPDQRHPLLDLRRAETRTLCELLALDPIDDPTNADLRFQRNRVRRELIPLIDSIADRDTTPLIVRAADLLRSDDDFLDELSADIDPTDARQIAASPRPLARRAMRRWLTVDGYPPDAAAIERVLAVAAGTHAACEIAGVGRIHRSRQRLFIDRASGPGTAVSDTR